MKVVWTIIARADRHAIYDYVEADNPTAALALDTLFSNAAERLSSHPMIGRVGRAAETRELVAHRHYVVIYDVAEDTVRILRILHTSQKWPSV